ncbi:MAG: ComF family protein, partial [Bacteroidetes bacterium]|nr:ComF family protein [Bacteroidota bacterium]
MGQKIGGLLEHTSWFETVDVLLPVPIHPKKKFIRGYNQSEMIAEGVSKRTGKLVNTVMLERHLHQESQTKQGRFNRWDNLQNTFRTKSVSENYRHVAIVDDVITTGATIEKIAQDLRQKNPALQISIITLAVAK